MLAEAHTLEELTAGLAEDLTIKGLPSAFSAEMAREFANEFSSFEIPTPKPGTLGFLVGHYAIRKDDFKIFDAVTDGLKSAAGVSFFTAHQPVLGANVAIGVTLAKLIRALAMRGTLLDADAIAILTILRCNASATDRAGLLPPELLTIIQRTKPEVDLGWVQQQLNALEKATRDGTTTKLASPDLAGRWHSHV